MSYWTYVKGIVEVEPVGNTQPQKRYVLDTVLEHLPSVTGSEVNMKVHVVQQYGYTCSSSHNEFGECFRYRRYHDAESDGLGHTQCKYTLVLEGWLRDRTFDETKRELNNWLNRLAKRIWVTDILVQLTGQDRSLIISDPDPYSQMMEPFSWCEESNGEPAWVEYLLWDKAKDFDYPLKLLYKYVQDPENDAEFARRFEWEHGKKAPQPSW